MENCMFVLVFELKTLHKEIFMSVLVFELKTKQQVNTLLFNKSVFKVNISMTESALKFRRINSYSTQISAMLNFGRGIKIKSVTYSSPRNHTELDFCN